MVSYYSPLILALFYPYVNYKNTPKLVSVKVYCLGKKCYNIGI